MEADTRRGSSVKSYQKTASSRNFRIERSDIAATADSQSDDDVCDTLLNPANLDKELDRIVDSRQRRSSEYEERALLSQRGGMPATVIASDPQTSNGDTCLTPLLKKSILKDNGRKVYVDEKAVPQSGGVIPKGLRRAFSIQDSRTIEVKSVFDKQHLSPTLPEKGEHFSRPPIRRLSGTKPEPVKAFVRFGETVTMPTGFSSSSPGLTTRANFLHQRASFQSDMGKLSQSQSSNSTGSSLLKQDAGIVCSNNDLRLILCDANRQRRHSADVRREKMKANRSLSFDSSMFRLRKNSNAAEPTILYSKHSAIASIASTTTATACTTALRPQQLSTDKEICTNDDEKHQKHVVKILITSDSPEEEQKPDLETTEAETMASEDSASASRRSSNVSNLECRRGSNISSVESRRGSNISSVESRRGSNISSVESRRGSNISSVESRRGSNISNVESRRGSNISNTESAARTTLSPLDPNRLSVEEGFKVAWDDSSVVDATVLGNAIETYLTGVGRQLSGDTPPRPSKEVTIQESSLRSSLKSLFVK